VTPDLGDRLAAVRERIADAARRSGRPASAITTIVVTKFQPVELVRELRELGVRDFGENRHQEAREKAALVPDVRWHFVGQLQGKKARQVRAYASAIHSVDRLSLVHALDAAAARHGRVLDCLLQVSLDGDPHRGGVRMSELPALSAAAAEQDHLRLRGVMAVAPLDADPLRAFAVLPELLQTVRRHSPQADLISAGMSGDLEAAVTCGATHLRVGSAILGPRPTLR
jgi:pyridoxal phosphate enzyme (YggS family)